VTTVRVDVVLARGTSAARAAQAAATLYEELGADCRVYTAGGDGQSLVPVVPPGGAALPDAAPGLSAEYVAVFAADTVPLPGALAGMLSAVVMDAREARDAVLLGVAVPVGMDGKGAREPMRVHTRRHHQRAARFADAAFVTVYGPDAVAVVLCRRSLVPAGFAEARLAGGPAALLDAAAVPPWRVVADPVAVRCGDRPNGSPVARVGAALARLRRSRRARPVDVRATIAMTQAALTTALGLEGSVERLREARHRTWQRVVWRALLPIGERLHDFVLTRFADWPIAWRPAAAPRSAGPRSPAPSNGTPSNAAPLNGAPRKLAYYLWRFPVLSETFIRRELGALAEAGVEVAILADGAGVGVADDPELAPLACRTRYVLPVTPAMVVRNLAAALVRAPLRTANLFAYTLCRPYNVPKSLRQDVYVFLKAVRVAALLRDLGVRHLHAPWGDTNAFIAMMAARLAGADFSLQFRAQDLHRRTLAFQVREKIHQARFVVTNTRYNLETLRALALPEDHVKIRQIYNGLELGRFQAAGCAREPHAGPVRILSVARLIEPKGLPYLFEACRILLDRGRAVRCAVVGGPELPMYVNDLIAIRRSRRRLDLDDIVELRGAQPFARVAAAYAAADIFVLPCVVGADGSTDIIPNSILEAMAMGVPVVATRITAIPELIEDGESGLLVPPNDAGALADAIDRLIADPAFAARLAVNARARIAERFDVATNVRAYAALFGGG